MARRGLTVGNWKMALSHKAAHELALSLTHGDQARTSDICEIVVCPSYPSLPGVADVLQHSEIAVGAQHVHWEERGAWTGQVSVSQISPFVRWCIVGHSEQRMLIHMTDAQAVQAAELLVRHDITPIVCIGETAVERERDETVAVVTRQTKALLAGLHRAAIARLVIAYEPIWAISTAGFGEVPDPADVSGILLLVRKLIAARFDDDLAQRVRLLYGGSVQPATVGNYAQEPGIDGVLVGAASLHPADFMQIAETIGAAVDAR